uniref:Transcobalamin-1 n=1 Tax=Sus scrofa TaxID=9823 RepID=TCO1_PIG|nr:RecName: Full=Transcobalamin-1; Short=TC-1; AltName: Full=Cobalophilin; AltName: Full=Haptocorrin; AltName: Full=Protein R; AltName: Full=Transcobalamin I; Short=TC I; Short=TCI; Flags: Precursor [Sus scrofa]
MRQSHQLPLVGLLLFSLIPSQLCQSCVVSEKDYSHLRLLISAMDNLEQIRGIYGASILLSQRLAGIQNPSLEEELSQRIQDDMNRRDMSNLTSGQLALIILAFGACKTPDVRFIHDHHLVEKLGEKFKEEIKNMEIHNSNPLTNYYQLSFDVLTLCLFRGNYSISNVTHYFNPENKNFNLSGHFSVDTGAVAVLALTCVKRSISNGKIKAAIKDSDTIQKYIESLVHKIQSEKMVVSLETRIAQEKLCRLSLSHQTITKMNQIAKKLWTRCLTHSQGVFRLPIAAAQILPALLGKTYLDVTKLLLVPKVQVNITDEPVPVVPTLSPENISVIYCVKINEISNCINITVFLDVMKAAQEKNSTIYGFTMTETPWGPYITSVQGIWANNNERTYWEHSEQQQITKPRSMGIMLSKMESI